jgi:hypothetical protein
MWPDKENGVDIVMVLMGMLVSTLHSAAIRTLGATNKAP